MKHYFGPDSPAKDVNDILLRYYAISLFPFAQVVASMFLDPCAMEREFGRSPHEVAKLKPTTEGLRADIIQGILRVDQLLSKARKKGPRREHDDLSQLIKRYGLDVFFEKLYNPTMELIRFYEENDRGYKGAIIKKSSLIAAGWGNIVKLKGLKIRWGLLADLYEWFWDKLKAYDYYRGLKPASSLINYLKIQHHRHKNYLICRDFVLVCCARSEGLTILARDLSISDAYFYALSKYSAMNKKSQSKYVLHEYLKCALDLYSKAKVDPNNVPPLIVFPDKSFFSTGF